jgi:hypothetical protein
MPHLVVVAGPNGAGKTTTAPKLLRDTLKIAEFVNADQIAIGLSGFRPEATAFRAGRLMLARIHELASRNESFASKARLPAAASLPSSEDYDSAATTSCLCIYGWQAPNRPANAWPSASGAAVTRYPAQW